MFLGKALLYGAQKTRGPVARGVVGVFTYYLPEISKTLAVMFSVPYDYVSYSNWFDVQLYSGAKRANNGLFWKMYKDDPFKGNDSWEPTRNLGSGLRMKGIMSSSGQATIQIRILKQ